MSTKPLLHCTCLLSKKGPLLVSRLVRWHKLAYSAITKCTMSVSRAPKSNILVGSREDKGAYSSREG